VGLAALAVAAEIHRDGAMVLRNRREHAVGNDVAVKRAGVAVQHEDRGPRALLDVANLHAVRVEEAIGRRRCLGGGDEAANTRATTRRLDIFMALTATICNFDVESDSDRA
jgi:hypothetical protein